MKKSALKFFFVNLNNSDKLYWIFFFVLFAAACLTVFININIQPAEGWDESIYAISASEMIKSGNYFVNTWQFIPDYSNTKPVLAFWPLVLSFKMFGFNLFAVRFMNAFCFIALVLITSLYLKKRFNNIISLTSTLCYIACVQILALDHSFRYGDCEPFYVFTAITSIIFMMESRYHEWAYIPATLFASFGFLTKSFHALILVIAVIAFSIMTRDYRRFRWWMYPILVLTYVLPIFLWGVGRYQYDQWEFFSAMIKDSINHTTSVVVSTGTYGWIICTIIANPMFVIMFIIGIVLAIKQSRKTSFKDVIKRIGKSFSYKNYETNREILICSLFIISICVIYIVPRTVYPWYAFSATTTLCIIFPIFIYNFVNKRGINVETTILPASALGICATVILVLNCIPKSLSGAEGAIVEYHNINPNSTEVFYMEDSCTQGNNEIEGWNSFNREHNVIYRIEVEYNWNISTGDIDNFKADNHAAILILNNNSDNYDSISETYHIATELIDYQKYGYTLFTNSR